MQARGAGDAMTRGSQPAFPQSVCPMLIYVGVDVSGGQGYQENVIEKHHGDNCPLCHGTGLVGGGLTVREWYIGQALQGLCVPMKTTKHGVLYADEKAAAKAAEEYADAVIARLEAGNG